ncbi:MAG TPA: NAD(+)/NADH kinase [Acidimicrobiales bacterium]
MAIIGLVTHENRDEAKLLAEDTALWLEAAGHDVRLLTSPGVTSRWGCSPAQLADGLDLAVSLGGDGTMLRTVDLVCGTGVPVLGVNVGHLGYLTEVDPDGLRAALKRFFAGDYRIEERMTLLIEVIGASSDTDTVVFRALNDAVLQRTTSGHTIRLSVTLGGEPFLTYAADSMIVASPTGSTAYNLSARGPIVSPRARLLLVTPVAAHMLFDRALVLAATEVVGMELIEGRQAELVVDGQSRGVLVSGDLVRCRAGDHDARLVTFGERDFHHILKQKFGLSDR